MNNTKKIHKSCSFFGHRKINVSDELEQKLKGIIEDLIINHNVSTFLFGSKSEFNNLCHKIVSHLKEIYPNIRRIAYTCKNETCIISNEIEKWEKIYSNLNNYNNDNVYLLVVEEEYNYKTKYTSGKASYLERNQEMIDNSDYCVFYFDENYKPNKRKISKTNNNFYQPKSGTALAWTYSNTKEKSIINTFIL